MWQYLGTSVQWLPTLFTVGQGNFDILCLYDALPFMLQEYLNRAKLGEQINLTSDGRPCFVALKRHEEDWPSLVVAQRYAPSSGVFYPATLLVPENHRLFIGAGTRLLCYDIDRLVRLWEDTAECAFWSWRHDDSEVFMAAELEFAVFDTLGKKLWTRFVEPPWDYSLEFDRVILDVMGSIIELDRRTGVLLSRR